MIFSKKVSTLLNNIKLKVLKDIYNLKNIYPFNALKYQKINADKMVVIFEKAFLNGILKSNP